MIVVCPESDQMRAIGLPNQAEGFPGNPEAAFNLGADGNIFYILPQRFGEEMIPFMPAVKAHFLPQQTGADPQLDLFHINYSPSNRTIDNRIISNQF